MKTYILKNQYLGYTIGKELPEGIYNITLTSGKGEIEVFDGNGQEQETSLLYHEFDSKDENKKTWKNVSLKKDWIVVVDTFGFSFSKKEFICELLE